MKVKVIAQQDKIFLTFSAKNEKEEQMRQRLEFMQMSYPNLCATESKVNFSLQMNKTYEDLIQSETPFPIKAF